MLPEIYKKKTIDHINLMSCKSRPRLSSNNEKKIDMSSVILYPFHNSQQSLTTISNTAIKIFLIFFQ